MQHEREQVMAPVCCKCVEWATIGGKRNNPGLCFKSTNAASIHSLPMLCTARTIVDDASGGSEPREYVSFLLSRFRQTECAFGALGHTLASALSIPSG